MKIQQRLKPEEILFTIKTQMIIYRKTIKIIKISFNKSLKLKKVYFLIKIINQSIKT